MRSARLPWSRPARPSGPPRRSSPRRPSRGSCRVLSAPGRRSPLTPRPLLDGRRETTDALVDLLGRDVAVGEADRVLSAPEVGAENRGDAIGAFEHLLRARAVGQFEPDEVAA